jgi:deoxyhypusine synthase
MPHRAPGAPSKTQQQYLSGRPIRYYRPRGSADIRHLIDEGFQAFNAARLGEACRIFADKMLLPEHDTTIGLTVAGALTPAGLGGCMVEMMERGLVDFVISTGANLYHDLHYALNFTLHRGSPFVDDVDLYDQGVIRIYDVLFPAKVLLETDRYIREFLVRSGTERTGVDCRTALCPRARPDGPPAGMRGVLGGRGGRRRRRARVHLVAGR